MQSVIYQTDNATFTFRLDDIVDHLTFYSSEYNLEEVNKLLNFLTHSRDPCIIVPEDQSYFAFVVIRLIALSKGSVLCTICKKSYEPNQLKLVPVGHGTSPFNINISKNRGLCKILFKRKRSRNPPMYGGKRYRCPGGHQLIATISWRT
jgi:hypothetical protein